MLWSALSIAVSMILSSAPLRAAPAPIRLGMIEGMSGPFANAGAAVERNLRLAVETVNRHGGVPLADGHHPLELVVFDSQGGVEQSLTQLRALADQHIPFVLQGNSSAVAAALINAISRQNAREPGNRELFLNYSAVDPALTGASCSFWHFRFDAHAGMRMAALAQVVQQQRSVHRVYLINQDYSFGHEVSALARAELQRVRPDIAIVGDTYHPIGRVKDFAPYVAKIRQSGADAVVTGNWGNDLTLLVKAAREQGLAVNFYTFYGNSLGAAAALGESGIGRVLAVAEWHPNAGGAGSEAFYRSFRERFPAPADDYPMLRMRVLVDMLAAAVTRAGSTDEVAVGRALEGAAYGRPNGAGTDDAAAAPARGQDPAADAVAGFHPALMRAADHQLLQPLYVVEMGRQGDPGIPHDNEGSGFGFRTVLALTGAATAPPLSCNMTRPVPAP